MSVASKWETLVYDSDYEINTEYPYPIRRVYSDKIVSEFVTNSGYQSLKLNAKHVLKHRMIGLQWIVNEDPENKTQIDHRDRNRLNNHISNLHWVSQKENANNTKRTIYTKGEFLDEMPKNIIQIEEYNEYEFDRYFFDIDEARIIMTLNNGKIKVVNPYKDGHRVRITFYDINKKSVKFGYNKLIDYLNNS